MDGGNLPEKEKIIASPDGVRFPVDKAILGPRFRRSIRSGGYEVKEATAIRQLVRKGDRVLEIGGGVGYISSLLAKDGRAAEIRSFEANPRLVPYIRRVHELNGFTTCSVTNALLADGPGPDLPFHIRTNFLASSMDLDAGESNIVETAMVPQQDIHALIAEFQPTFLVCDIEGAEAHLLPAADWSGLRVAVVELHPQWIGQAGVQAVFDGFHRAGLTYFAKTSHAKVVSFKRGF
ncbi:FkbM family methyltransferase [Litorisediminicola beolgyonensis]|uniref:FkbM family methyltransferase n=1 Tax=Litorisediminicola beolgyonensis TaxID=1173614 RepID=A0ABW3ZK48_9RHOB